jgi:carbonic anhydrase
MEFPRAVFDDVLSANEEYAKRFQNEGLGGRAARGLALVTCMDSRIDPLAMLGMHAGDMKIIRNAGARVTDDVLRTLVLAVHLLGVERILVVPHTNCKMASGDDGMVHEALSEATGLDTRWMDIGTTPDQIGALQHGLTRIRTMPYIPSSVTVAGAIYDVFTGRLDPLDL